jgi:transposase
LIAQEGVVEHTHHMKKEEKLVNKVKRLIRKAGLPRWLHRFGPKKFKFWQLALGLLIKEVFRLSYRRAMAFLSEFYGIDLHWTTLQKCRKRLPLGIWQRLLEHTVEGPINVAAIDGTSMQRNNPSEHYLRRIDRDTIEKTPVFLSAMVDVVRRKFLFARHHAKRFGEIKDVPYLVEKCGKEIDLLLMDKAYDSEKLHRYLRERGTYSIVPVKKNWARGQIRKQLKDCFDYSLYWQRNLVEALFSALKRLFGNHLRGLTARTQRAELYMRLIAYNLGAVLFDFFY